jgi:hypothetical protein
MVKGLKNNSKLKAAYSIKLEYGAGVEGKEFIKGNTLST